MRKKIYITALLLLMAIPCWSATQWRNGANQNTIRGTINISDIDAESNGYIVTPLDILLTNYKEGVEIQYSSASQLTVTAGEIMVKDVNSSVKLMLQNTANTTVTWADIDTGAEASGTTYYIYATAASNTTTAITFKISTSSSAPTGVTYYKRIGSFVNDSSSNITAIINDGFFSDLGIYESKSSGTTYQALTDGIVTASGISGCEGVSDSSSSPTTVIAEGGNSSALDSITFPVPKGYYYKVTCTSTEEIYWTPIN